jgi:poly(hydroxyalkanoate) depolymerase family esterase
MKDLFLKTEDSFSRRLLRLLPFSRPSRKTGPAAADGITATIQRALASAGLDTKSGPLSGVAKTIDKALCAAGLNSHHSSEAGSAGQAANHRVYENHATAVQPDVPFTPASSPERSRHGEFLSRSFSNGAGRRNYKLYVPASYEPANGNAVPMVVMLHGCKQSPDDFATGTRMNALAEEHGFLVVYPGQANNANGSNCWNWFRGEDQRRDAGEPSLIAGITREVASEYKVDQRRIFVAGLSAGAAMAVILGVTYPELYAAVGAHSGLPYAAAHDVASAFSAMKGGSALAGLSKSFTAARSQPARLSNTVPTIVFHGDADHTVAASNAMAIVEATVAATDAQNLQISTHDGVSATGSKFSRTVYSDSARNPVVEYWILHGAGHAWSGGSAQGSYTNPSGPDASAEMIRFFYVQARAGTA